MLSPAAPRNRRHVNRPYILYWTATIGTMNTPKRATPPNTPTYAGQTHSPMIPLHSFLPWFQGGRLNPSVSVVMLLAAVSPRGRIFA
ncbi:hypothetical protein PJL18_04327 [Paenarthrobacter nicotinovorans]|nr:hypothetical protein [Paenarthrobacter nicotinovorans]